MKHNECNGTVLVDVTSSYKMLAEVIQDKGGAGFNTAEIHVYNTKETCSELVYWCVKCDEEVSPDDIKVICRGCSNPIAIKDGIVPLETGGIWCDSCIEDRCGEEDNVSLQSIYDNDCVNLT